MRTQLLHYLCCPHTRQPLTAIDFCSGSQFTAEVAVETDAEIEHGVLTADRRHAYPIWNGIPRVLPSGLRSFPAFTERFRDELARCNMDLADQNRTASRGTSVAVKKQFERQWAWWGCEEKLYGRTPDEWEELLRNGYIGANFQGDCFDGQCVLDAGCGHGVFSRALARMGAHVIAVDFGNGIEVARDNCRDHPSIDFVQADILHLPIAGRPFDLVYCHGVLPFVPSPESGFVSLANVTNIGGYLRIWVYPRGGTIWEATQNLLRGVLSRLPSRVLYYLCFVPVPLLSIVQTYSNTSLATSTWRQCAQVVWDYYSSPIQWHFTPEAVAAWFRESGFGEVDFLPIPISALGKKTEANRRESKIQQC